MKDKVLIVEDQFVEANYLRSMLQRAGYLVTGIARSVQKAIELIKIDKPSFVLLDIFLSGKSTGIDLANNLKEENIPFIYLSANSNEDVLNAAKTTQPYGFLVKPFREKDLLITLEIARYRHQHSIETILKQEQGLATTLSAIMSQPKSWPYKLPELGKAIQPYLPFDYLAAGFNRLDDASCNSFGLLRIGFTEYQVIGSNELLNITRLKPAELAELSAQTSTDTTVTIYNGEHFQEAILRPSLKKVFADAFHLQSHLALPLDLSDGQPFSLCLYSQRPDTYTNDHIELSRRINTALTSIFKASPHTIPEPNGGTPGRLQAANNIKPNHQVAAFKDIIGSGNLILNLFDHITQVAPVDTSVLLLGESGTGKERIAESIHKLSSRRNQQLVKVNCAALPATLIESELFGHEKGAFTGAIERRTGKFELADKGTIFLDEIGEMPVESQVKLLRVLQEKEVERIGSNFPQKVDVRIIAATNRNLEKEVAEGRFRLDLYYRLNVFPITLPPLRERKEDIILLAEHFIRRFSHKAGKNITGLSDKARRMIISYHWPGNIRELENFIERSVLLAKGTLIEDGPMSTFPGKQETTNRESSAVKTIQENERDHIMAVLKQCHGRIWGPGAAAEVLNILPSTLKSKMKKLGIRKEYTD